MRVKRKGWQATLVVACLLFGGVQAFADPLVFTASTDATAMVNSIVGSGITVTGTPTYTGGGLASGFFSGGNGILGFDSGIVLTTGQGAQLLPGPNMSGSTSSDLGLGGYAPLTTLAGNTTYDAAVLSFKFIPTAGVVSFRFVFGSEEYNEWVGSQFNDVFGFFLNNQNIALIPGTSAPITINAVNLGSNSQYYTDNTSGARNTELDGLVGASIALYATGPVNVNVENTIALAVADTSDHVWDSAVFIQGGTFVPTPPPVPLPPTLLLFGSGLLGLVGWRIRKH